MKKDGKSPNFKTTSMLLEDMLLKAKNIFQKAFPFYELGILTQGILRTQTLFFIKKMMP